MSATPIHTNVPGPPYGDSLEVYPTERRRRFDQVGPLMAELRDRGLRWKDARLWGLTQIESGAEPGWRPAHMPPQAPNPMVVARYLDHLDLQASARTCPGGDQ